jgi:hypothetical protein
LATDSGNNVENFFGAYAYQGAFRPGENWAAGWTSMWRLGYFPTCSEQATATPNEPSNLVFTNDTDLVWDAPWGGNFDYYDVLRSTNPADFSMPMCPEETGRDRVATDAETPAVGNAFFYLIRAGNDCGDGQVGIGSDGAERQAGACMAN